MGQWPWGQGPDCLRDLLLGSGEPTVSLSPASGGDTAVSVLGGLWQREELRVLWESWKTACLLKDGSSYVWTGEICLVVQSTWWFTALKKSCCAYLTHLWVVDYLLSFLHKWSLACREHQGRSRSYKQFDVSKCDQSLYDVLLPLLSSLQYMAKQALLSKGKCIAAMGTHSVSVVLPRQASLDINKETYRT